MKKKKGFTLVELLVVIAILAILAAVSVVGYLSFTNKAKESNDISLTTQMNTVLQANEALEKPESLDKVIEQIDDDGGINLEQITPNSKGYNYAWDKATNRIILLDENNNIVAPENAKDESKTDTIIIVKTKEQLDKVLANNYGIALASTYTELENNTLKLNKAVSFDNYAGKVKELTIGETSTASLYSNNDSNIYIAGDFDIVNLSLDTKLSVYGTIATMELTKGTVMVEKEASISTIKAENADANARVNITSNASVGNIFAKENSDILANSNKKPNDPELKPQSDTDKLFAGGTGNEASPYLISNEEEFLKINELYNSKEERITYQGNIYHFKQIRDLYLEVANGAHVINYFTGTYDGGNHSINYTGNPILPKPINGQKFAVLFNIVFGKVTIKNVVHNISNDFPMALILNHDWYADKLDIILDNIVVNSLDEEIKFNASNFGLLSINAFYNFSSAKILNCISNVNFSNDGTSTGVFLGAGPYVCGKDSADLYFENCVNNGNVQGVDQIGLLYGNGAYVGYYPEGDGSKIPGSDYQDIVHVKNVKNNGTLLTVYKNSNVTVAFAPKSKYLNDKYQDLSGGKYLNDSYFNNKQYKFEQDGLDYKISLSEPEITFKITYGISALDVYSNGTYIGISNTTRYFFDMLSDVTITNATKILEHKACDLEKAKIIFGDDFNFEFEDGISRKIKDDVLYIIFEKETINRHDSKKDNDGICNITLYAYAYDRANTLKGMTVFK